MSERANRALVVIPPAPLPPSVGRPVIFLAGSIDNGNAPDWQTHCCDLVEAPRQRAA